MAIYSFAGLLLACCKKKPQFPFNVSFRRIHSQYCCGPSTDSGSCSPGMRILLQNYIDGSVMSPFEKHCVRQELQRNNMKTSPSDAAMLLYTVMDGYDTIVEPILKGLEGHVDHLWDEKCANDCVTDEVLNTRDEDAGRRRDLTRMETITIDDEMTTDIDDGLSASLVDTDGTVCVSIHIADPTRWLSDPSSLLAMQARNRGRTLYLPHKKLSMLPPSLGAEVCSLREGYETAALTMSCLIRTSDGSIVDNSIDITPSIVVSDKKLSYNTVDAYIEETSSTRRDTDVIHLLHLVAESRARKREDSGALTLSPSNELSFNASLSPYSIDISSNSIGKSKARRLVSEMMILAGEIFGQVGKQCDIPLPYRGQQIPVVPTTEDLLKYPKGPCRNFYLRKYMLKSIVNARTPQRHESLGLEQYVQSTSPIRRYMDMLAHWQMKSVLRGGHPVYTSNELQEIIDDVTLANAKLTMIERKIQVTWLCAYFLDHQNIELDAIVLHWVNQEHSLAIVYISSIGKEVVATVLHPVALGEHICVYCTFSDPLTQSLSFSTQPRTDR